ncbi:MAG: hypothetical protein ACYSW6_02715 [Planctomycetota bacterium]
MKHARRKQSRRQLFARVLRYTGMAAIGGAGTIVFARRRRLVREGKCINNGPGQSGCRDCGILSNCVLPQGLSARRVLTRMEDAGK